MGFVFLIVNPDRIWNWSGCVYVSADPSPKNPPQKQQQQPTAMQNPPNKNKKTTSNDKKTHTKFFVFVLKVRKGRLDQHYPYLHHPEACTFCWATKLHKGDKREREQKKKNSPSSFFRDEVLEIFMITAITILCAGNGRGASQRHRDNSAPGGPEGPDAGHRSPRQHLHPLPTVLRARLAHLPPEKAAGARGGRGGGGARAEACQGETRLAILVFCLALAFLLFPWPFLWLAVKLATIASGSCLMWFKFHGAREWFCVLDHLEYWGAWDAACGWKAKDGSPLITWRSRNAWQSSLKLYSRAAAYQTSVVTVSKATVGGSVSEMGWGAWTFLNMYISS